MGRNRARAAAVVIGTTLASVAYAQLTVTSNPATTDPAPIGTTAYVVVTLRNTSPTDLVEIDSIMPDPAKPVGCNATFTTMFAPVVGMYPVTLMPGEQAQFFVDAVGSASSTTGCPFDVTTANAVADTTFGVQLQVSAAPRTIQVQPLVNDFGTVAMGSSEDQYIFVENLGTGPVSGYTATLTNANAFSFPDCGSASSCTLGTVNADGYQPVRVRCSPPAIGPQTGMVVVYAASAAVGSDMMVTCNGGSAGGTGAITVSPKPLDIMTSPMATGSAFATIDQTGSGVSWTGAQITGADASYFAFADPACPGGGQTCTPSTPPMLPYLLGVECTPPDSTTRSATLTVGGQNGSTNTFDTTQLNCIPSGGGPHIVVSPLMIAPPSLAVGQSEGPYSVLVQNTGGGVLTVTGAIMGTGAGDWTADSCIAATCMIGSGSSTSIGVTFAPQAYGNRDAQLVLDNNDTTPGDSPQIVNLYGSASGGVLAVTDPVSGELAFGTLPRNQLAQQPITAANQGNATIDVVVSAGAAAFQTATSGFSLLGGMANTFQAGCMSATPGNYDSYITLTSANAYAGSPAQVHVTCTVAPTDVQVTPTSFDFGEVRIHAQPAAKDVAITNPTASAVHVTRIALDASRAGLALAGGFTGDMTLAAGGTLMATLTLTPDAEVDLAGVNLAIDVDGVALSFPITGKVVTPHSSITPAKLDLGTACLGTSPTGIAMLVNDGTATLAVQAPVMDQSFVAMFDSPTSYPAALAPGGHAATSIRPMSTANAGALHGTLSWIDDVPSSYAVDVDVSFIAAGTALSPSALSFGAIEVNNASPLQEITLQNCDPDPVTVAIVGVEPSSGTADAWAIAPAPGYMKTLAAHEKLTIDAQFAPKQRGSFQAKLKLTANGAPLTVTLTGSATSQSLLHTDFYACSCDSPGAGAGGWLVALAIVLVVVPRPWRRRRGSSSAR
ncbi:MAG: choice-of-anchor D domain-containing protein [Acidobacteriota bacterium]